MFKYIFTVVLLSISTLSQACQITPSTIGNEYLINEECQLTPYNSTHVDQITPSTQYFVQYLYASSFHAYLNIKADIQSKFDQPIAFQPYNYGYRMLIGPVDYGEAQNVLSELKRRGYRDALIKFYNQSQTSETISIPPETEEEEQSKTQATLLMPRMLPIFSLGGSTALLPIYDKNYKGKVTHYNSFYIGNFTFQQAQAVCKEFNSKIASIKQYSYMLSNMDFVMEYAVKSQFWLNSDNTITRIQDQVTTRQQSEDAYFNVICVTQ